MRHFISPYTALVRIITRERYMQSVAWSLAPAHHAPSPSPHSRYPPHGVENFPQDGAHLPRLESLLVGGRLRARAACVGSGVHEEVRHVKGVSRVWLKRVNRGVPHYHGPPHHVQHLNTGTTVRVVFFGLGLEKHP